jgi:hypothetical protein
MLNSSGYKFLTIVSFLSLIVLASSGCRDTRNPEATLGTSGAAIKNNDFETFKITLMNPALREWGTPEQFQKLRQLIPAQTPRILKLELIRKESCGHNSCVHRFYDAQIGSSAESQPQKVLLDASILCRKVAKHRECWIYDISPASSPELSTLEASDLE